jgi:hypothetical protein
VLGYLSILTWVLPNWTLPILARLGPNYFGCSILYIRAIIVPINSRGMQPHSHHFVQYMFQIDVSSTRKFRQMYEVKHPQYYSRYTSAGVASQPKSATDLSGRSLTNRAAHDLHAHTSSSLLKIATEFILKDYHLAYQAVSVEWCLALAPSHFLNLL